MQGPILITGAGGLLGTEFSRALADVDVQALGSEALDIRDADSVWRAFDTTPFQWVVNTAAFTSVDKAEQDRQTARAVNTDGVRNLVKACREYRSKLIHFSTDQVFDGKGRTPWKETDTPNPSNFYAQTKLESERLAAELPDALILRVQWLYGDKNPRFLHLRERGEFSAVNDQIGAPTWSADVVRLTLALAEKSASGLFHLSYDDHASWLEVFEFVKECLGCSVHLKSVSTDTLGLVANRPRFAVLDNSKLKSTLGLASAGSWKTSLSRFLGKFK